jgi:hypothetical protein
MKIFELFNQTAAWEWNNNKVFDHTDVEAHFEVKGTKYVAGFATMFGKSMFGFMTNVDGEWRENDTGEGNEFVVFATIMDIVTDYVQRYHPDELTIGGVPGRERIYTRLLNRKRSEIENAGYELDGPQRMELPHYGETSIFTIKKAEA